MTKFFREAKVEIRIRNQDFDGYITTIRLEGLRVSFSIVKSLAWSTNTCQVRIWNLSQSHRNLIKDFGDELLLYAGYELEAGPQLLFIGQTTSVSHIFQQPEIITTINCGDGEGILNQKKIVVSYVDGAPARTIINDMSQLAGIPVGYFPVVDNLIYRQGYEYIGPYKDGVSDICGKLSLEASVQDGFLQVLPSKRPIVQETIYINELTGMQGIPQRYTYKRFYLFRSNDAPTSGYKVNVALNPFIKPGAKVQLESSHLGIKSDFRVENVRHEGDTYGFIWSSQLELEELVQ